MASVEDADYRLRLAEGFLEEARQDVGISRWRSCVDNSQLATENATKAVLTLLGPVGRSHSPAELLREAHEQGSFPLELSADMARLIELSKQLGWSVHVASDYGDEEQRLTPWELFDEVRSQAALKIAEEVNTLARNVVKDMRTNTE